MEGKISKKKLDYVYEVIKGKTDLYFGVAKVLDNLPPRRVRRQSGPMITGKGKLILVCFFVLFLFLFFLFFSPFVLLIVVWFLESIIPP
jgi:hypothetical protein